MDLHNVDALRKRLYKMERPSRWRVLVANLGLPRSVLLAMLPVLAGCDYGAAVVQNITWGVKDCVDEAGLAGCLAGIDLVELLTGALMNGALYGVQ